MWFVFLVLLIAAFVPVVPFLPVLSDVPNIERIALVGGTLAGLIVAVHFIRSELKNRHTLAIARANAAKHEAQDKINVQLTTENLRRDAIAALSKGSQRDNSEAGYEWQTIQISLEPKDFRRYLKHYPESPHCSQCREYEQMLWRWQNVVDQTDPVDVRYFLMLRPYLALEREAQATLRRAIDAASEHREREFWDAVWRPFGILVPLLFPLGLGVYVVPVILFRTTGQAQFGLVVSRLTGLIENAVGYLPIGFHSKIDWIRSWLFEQAEVIARLGLVALACTILMFAFVGLTKLVGLWHTEQRRSVANAISSTLSDFIST